ncbi:DUF1631 domain-containing protein [Xanthomonas campestris pv. asclepiadis]|uniref:DUF1631 family protein n=1 Tax=Xanthomonas campestris TaxID=339 RepID=UPI001E539BE1|nr:DUF1631 family protein [Xanthomonas campestris]MCC4616082.1 DUF1631 domain-containing protein [Xanthomonas campestris pv. asclepiadis]
MTQFVSTPVLSSRNPHLLDQVRESVLVPLADAGVHFQDALAEALFRLAADAGAAQNDLLEVVQAARQQRKPITARFLVHLANAWQRDAGRGRCAEPASAAEGLTPAGDERALASATATMQLGCWLDTQTLGGHE